MLGELLVYDDLEPRPAALNMAIDEALLLSASVPILRYYRWKEPAVSFGYFGEYAEVAAQSGRREIVRRWTGGGIVPHGDDLTYSVIIPRSHPFFGRSSLEIYGSLHEGIRLALEANHIAATLADAAAQRISDDCFANPVRADVISDNRKIAGAAHRRSRAGLLHQGSIQRSDLPDRFRENFARILADRFEKKALPPGTLDHAAEIAAAKYASPAWLRRR